MAATFFAINPNKQNFYEKIAREFIKVMPDVEDCRILPTNSLYVLDGMIMKEPEVKHYLSQKSKVNPPPKTIDIVYQHCKSTYYVSHKYTKDEG